MELDIFVALAEESLQFIAQDYNSMDSSMKEEILEVIDHLVQFGFMEESVAENGHSIAQNVQQLASSITLDIDNERIEVGQKLILGRASLHIW